MFKKKQKVNISEKAIEGAREGIDNLSENDKLDFNASFNNFNNFKKFLSKNDELNKVFVQTSGFFVNFFNLDEKDEKTLDMLFSTLLHFIFKFLIVAKENKIDVYKEIEKYD